MSIRDIVFLKDNILVFTIFVSPHILLVGEVFVIFSTIEYLLRVGEALFMQVLKDRPLALGGYQHIYW